jgi:hypothetical protein
MHKKDEHLSLNLWHAIDYFVRKYNRERPQSSLRRQYPKSVYEVK